MEGYPFGLSDDLTEADTATMEATPVDLGHGRSRSVADLVVSWAGHVNRLHAEQYLRPGEDNEAWTAHDYVAALIIRDFVERALRLLPRTAEDHAFTAVTKHDELLRSFTEPDATGVLQRFAPDEWNAGWWWQRLPQSGPVRQELDAFAART
ncbi:hypothetical protein Rhe02_00310 [Rhizocola hellebori]|uniref:Uncharacterized protein n=1 Tax=Rhizocola hellebori TaxID=1392758 RepID=A0A8J3Q1M5_9ACTN|nr:hypothetical protein [Rhizocola hellebori]GIH01964.1 hypothetical protein Rhe02_00310 [Rhizocola hellebori]